MFTFGRLLSGQLAGLAVDEFWPSGHVGSGVSYRKRELGRQASDGKKTQLTRRGFGPLGSDGSLSRSSEMNSRRCRFNLFLSNFIKLSVNIPLSRKGFAQNSQIHELNHR